MNLLKLNKVGKIWILFTLFIVTLSGCNSIKDNNTIFTNDLSKNIKEINYWFGNEKVVITNKDDIQTIYNNLSSLQLTQKTDMKIGQIYIDIITNTYTLRFGIGADELVTNNVAYSIDKDLTKLILDIALKYKN